MDFLRLDAGQTLISAGTEDELLTSQLFLKPEVNSQENNSILNSEILLASPTPFEPLLTRQTVFSSNAEPNIIAQPQKDTLLAGLNNFIDWLDTKLETTQGLAQNLIYTNENLGHFLDVSEIVRVDLVTPIRNYLERLDDSTDQGLLDIIKNLPIITDQNLVTVNVSTDSQGNITSLQFNLDIQENVSKKIDLNIEEQNQLKLQTQNQIDLSGNISSNFSFGFQTSNNQPEFFVDINTLLAQGQLNHNINSLLNLGVLETQIQDGTIVLDANLTVQVNDPNQDGKLTINELNNYPINSLVTVSSTGELDIELPIIIGNQSLNSQVNINDNNIFDQQVPIINISPFSELQQELLLARNNDIEQIKFVLNSLGNAIQKAIPQINPNSGLPFLNEEIEEVIDFSSILKELEGGLIENQVVGKTEFINGKIDADAEFSIKLGTLPTPVKVKVLQSATADNNNIGDLITDINDALERTGLSQIVKVAAQDNKVLIKTVNSDEQFSIFGATGLGLPVVNTDSEKTVFNFNTIWQLKDIIPNTNSLVIEINIDKTFEKDLELDLGTTIKTSIGDLTFVGKTEGEISADASLNLQLILDLTVLELTPETKISVPSDSRDNLNDIKILFRDGSTQEINFDKIINNNSIQIDNLISYLKTQTGNKLNVEIDLETKVALKLTDTTEGDQQFGIIPINDSLIGFKLGITNFDSTGNIVGADIIKNANAANPGLEPTTLLTTLNEGRGVRDLEKQTDLRLKLKNGQILDLDITIKADLTLQEIINTIQTQTQNQVSVALDETGTRLSLTDKTIGDTSFSIEAINDSTIGQDLGILQSSTDGVILGTPITNYGESLVERETDLILSYNTPVYQLNTGRGIRVIPGNDFNLRLKNNITINIDLTLNENSLLGDILDAINIQTKGDVTATLNDNQSGIILIDNTSGIERFTIITFPGSLAALDLGILEESSEGIIQGTAINQVLKNNTKLSQINQGNGVRNPEADLEITLRDGTKFTVDLTNLTTIQQVLQAINDASEKIEANLFADLKTQTSTKLAIFDQTLGAGKFTIKTINNSQAGVDLGIIGSDTDGVILSSPLVDNSLISHLSIDSSSTLEVDASVQADDIDLTAALGLLKVGVENGTADFGFNLDVSLQDPTPATSGITISELFNSNLALSDNTPVQQLNTGRGIRVKSKSGDDLGNDLILKLKNGETININLTLDENSQVKNVLEAINNQASGKVTARLNEDKLGINLTDNTVGNEIFKVLAANGSLAGVDLGILGESSEGNLKGQAINPPFQATYQSSGTINLPLVIQGLDTFNITELIAPNLEISLSSTIDNPFKVTYDLSGIDNIVDKLAKISDFSTDNLLDLVNQAIQFFSNSNLGYFNQKIPILNKSLNELLDFLQPIQEAYQATQSQLENLKINLKNSLKSLDEKVLNPTLLAQLPAATQENLQDALIIFRNAVEALPTSGTEILERGIPSQLIAAIEPLKDAILNLPNAVFEALKIQLDTAIGKLPNTIDLTKLNQAKEKFYNVINDPLNVGQAFDELKIAVSQILDTATAQALRQLKVIQGQLEAAVPKGVQAISQIKSSLDTLEITITNLPTGIDKNALNAAKDKLKAAFNNLDVSLLPQGIEDLSNAINKFPVPEIGEVLADIDEILAKYTGKFVQNAFDELLELIPSQEGIINFLQDLLHADQVSLSFDGQNNLILNLDWNQTLTKSVPLDFGIDLGNSIIPINFTNAGNVDIALGTNISLDLGFDFQAPVNTAFYLLPSTELAVTANIESKNFNATASLGVASVTLGDHNPNTTELSIKDGNQAASFRITLSDNDGKIFLDELPSAINVEAPKGVLALNLPLVICEQNQGALTANFDFQNPSSFIINFPPDLLNNLEDLALDCFSFEPLIKGIESLLDFLENKLLDDLLDKLPFIGDELDLSETFIQKLRNTFLDENLLRDLRDPNLSLEDKLSKLEEKIENAYGDIIDDLSASEFAFTLALGGIETITSNFDLGFSALGLSIDTEGSVNTQITYNLPLTIGLDKTQGFFIEIPENISIGVDVSLAEDATLEGKLAFLKIKATNGVDNLSTSVESDFNITIDGDINNDGKLTTNELASFAPSFSFNATAALALHLMGQLGSNDDLPSIEADLLVDIRFIAGEDARFEINSAGIFDITLNVGGFLGSAVTPFLKTVDTYLEPVRPILKFLTLEIPIVSSLSEAVGMGKFTTLDALALYSDDPDQVKKLKRLIEIVQAIDGVVQLLKGIVDVGGLELGDYYFIEPSGSSQDTAQLNFNPDNIGETEIISESALSNLGSAIDRALAELKELGISIPIIEALGDPGEIIPIIVNLILGKPIDLINWELPSFSVGYTFLQSFFIFPPYPVLLTISGGADIAFNFSVGLDTRGLLTGNFLDGLYFGDRENIDQGDDIPELAFSAFFAVGAELNIVVAAVGVEGGIRANVLADWNDPNNDGKLYYDELLRNARQSWMCVFDFSGGLEAFLRAYLIIGFRYSGIFIKIYEKKVDLFQIPLFQFSSRCDSDSSDTSPNTPLPPETQSTLAHYSKGTEEDRNLEKDTLIIHVGDFADLRQPGVSRDVAEELYITRQKSGALEVHYPFRPDYQSQSSDPAPTGSVQVFGDDPDEPIVTKIYIDAGDGNDLIEIDDLVTSEVIIIGGVGDDTIKAGSGKGLIAGGAGNDLIYGSRLDDTLVGGVFDEEDLEGQDGRDTITGRGGADLIFGDNGGIQSTINGNDTLVTIKSFALSDGGNDVILVDSSTNTPTGNNPVSNGNDTVFGGKGNDQITSVENNRGDDILFGDHGRIERIDSKITKITSENSFGGDDVIVAGIGNDTVLGGGGGDRITNDLDTNGEDVLFGDNGTIELTDGQITHWVTTDFAIGGNDTIAAGLNLDFVAGGGGDDLVTNEGDDHEIFFGDQGEILTVQDSQGEFIIDKILSLSASSDGNDTLDGAAGNDTILAGGKDDVITDATGEDILFGDHGKVEFTNQIITLIESTDFANDGDDHIAAGLDRDTVFGGGQNDLVTNDGDISKDIIFGDQGRWQADLIQSLSDLNNDGNDTLYGEGNNDTILGGGKDDSISGIQGEDILFGDHGQIIFNQAIISYIESSDFTNGGNDTLIAGIDQDTVIGGARNDLITNEGDTSPDVLYGDQGYWDATIIRNITDPNDGDDKIYSEGGNDTILAGGAKDYVESGTDLDIVLGDHGIVTRNTDTVIRIETIESDSGDDDMILAGNDDDTVFAGPKNDRITGDTNNNGDDILVGDQGYWTPELIVAEFDVSSNPDGEDTIFGNGGNDTVFGNDDRDYIEGNQGLDILVGDYGIIEHAGKLAKRIDTIDATRKNIDVTKGNDDFIDGGDNNDTIIGGTASDSLVGGYDGGRDIILGDNGTVVNADGSSQSNDIFSHSPLYGGIDRVYAGPGDDTIVGGSGGKDTTDPKATTLTGKTGDGISGNEGNDLAVGDNAYITRNSEEKVEKIEIAVSSYGGVKVNAANYGGDDYILGNAGNDSIIGGFGKDSAGGGEQEDILFGDNAFFDYTLDSQLDTLDLVMTTDVILGDNDTLLGDQGNDLIFGGTRSDTISGGAGNDLILGDHGKAEGKITLSALPLNQANPPFTYTAIATQTKDLGGNDSVRGDGDDDIILGQQGNDRLFGDDGQDDLIGGHNVVDGADGGDEIDGGSGNDAIAGDNATIQRRPDHLSPLIRVLSGSVLYDVNGNPQMTDASQSDPKGTPGRNIGLLNHSTTAPAGTYGNDAIAGGANDDLIFGQLGNDTIQGDSSTSQKPSLTKASVEGSGDGDDYIEGGGGKDLIFGNLGQDDLIGGSSNLFGTPQNSDPLADLPSAARPDDQDTIFGGAGTKIGRNELSNNDRVRDADVILGDNGNIFRLVGTNGVNSGQYLTFNYNQAIARVVQFLDYTVGTTTGNLGNNDVIRGEAGDDEIYGMTGHDVIFGDGQDDNLYGGVGSDRLYGGTGDDGILGDDGQILTSRNGEVEALYGVSVKSISTTISIPDAQTSAVIYPIGTLHKQANLLAFTSGGNDVIYGGLGNDSLHGGAGDDAISGAEALAEFYNSNPVSNLNPLGYNASTRKFAAYDASNPRQKIANFLLNFEAFKVNPKNSVVTKIDDGQDHIFGDLGNDWLVGGTQDDRLFGGMGDDLINADDNHDTDSGRNDQPDEPTYADGDLAFGGGDLDVLLANTDKDRLIDWFNDTYILPLALPESPVITRQPSDAVIQFLLELSKASGADQSKTEPNGELGLVP